MRESKGIQQDEAAELLEISPSYLSLIEHGKKEPSHDVLVKLANLYKVPLHLLIWNEDDLDKRTMTAKERDLMQKMNEYLELLFLQIMKRNAKRS